jgi:hypothetical protein
VKEALDSVHGDSDRVAWAIPESVWSQSVGDIKCLTRTVNALLRNRYFTLGQLDGLLPSRMAKLRNIGDLGIKELSDEIAKISVMGIAYFSTQGNKESAHNQRPGTSLPISSKARQAIQSKRYLEKWFPTLPQTIKVPENWLAVRIDSCRLDNRTANSLERNGFNFLRDLNGMPTYELLHIRGLGTHGVMDLTSKLDDLFEVEVPDPRLIRLSALPSDIQDALNFISRNNPDLDDRVIFVVKARFGLLGERRMTLQQIGDLLRVSRERVRQLEAIGLRRLKKGRGSLDWTAVSASSEWKALLDAIEESEL